MVMFPTRHLSRIHIPKRDFYYNTLRITGTAVRNFHASVPCRVPKEAQKKWRDEDTALLIRLREHENQKWGKIGEHFPGRSLDSIRARYSRISGKTKPKIMWTDEEHQRLMKMKKDGESWRNIAATFPGRTVSALYTRWTRTEGVPNKKYVKWSLEEDQLLLEHKERGDLVKDYAQLFPNRTLGAIYRRYTIIGPRGKYGRLLHTGYRGVSDEDRDEIFKLHATGMTPTQIHAEHFSQLELYTVRNVIKLGRRGDEMGERGRFRQRWTRADDKTVLRMRQKEHK